MIETTTSNARWRRSRTTERDLISDEAERLKKLTKKTQRKRLSDEAEIDSVDSLICAYEHVEERW
jgi:hypothetical protein